MTLWRNFLPRWRAWHPLSAPVSAECVAWWTTLCAWFAVIGLLFARRWLGTFAQSLEAIPLVALASGCAGLVVMLRQNAANVSATFGPVWRAGILAAPSVAAVLTLSVATLSGSWLPAIIVAWSVLSAAEAWWWTKQASAQFAPSVALDSIDAPRSNDEEPLPEGVSQQLTRLQNQEGESIVAVLRASFLPREQTHVLHVAFCPPLSSPPTVNVAQIAGPDAAIKVTQAETFGARIELKLTTVPATEAWVVVELEATSPRNA